MAEYIEREKVLALQTDLHFDNIEQLKHWKCRHIDPTEVQLLPADDVRPVCLCRDCKYGQGEKMDFWNEYEGIECIGGVVHRKDWFCADGEKRRNEHGRTEKLRELQT